MATDHPTRPLVASSDGLSTPRFPVVLMHGIGLTAHVLKTGHAFTPIVRHMRRQGVRAYAPRVPPYNPTEVRAKAWFGHVETILRDTGSERVNLLGFSTGGLDARYLVSRLGHADMVASVTTLAAPHRGSALAELPLKSPRWVRSPMVRLVSALARKAYPDVPPDVIATLRELTRDHMTAVFNPGVPDHPDVAYLSWAARAGKGAPHAVSPLVFLMNRYVYAKEGVNDGFVSVESARWTGYRGCLEADHAHLVGIADWLGPFDARTFYTRYARELARKGF